MIENAYYLLTIFLGIVLLSVWLDSRFKWARKISPVVMILFLAGLASNVGLITDRADFYDDLAGFTVPFAVSLILFSVNLKDMKRSGGPLLAAFGIACVSTVIGVVTAGLLLNSQLTEVMGADTWKLAGPFTGTYTGGSLNFFAMWEGLEIGNPDLFAAANAVDNVSFFPLFALWAMIPVWLGKWYPSSKFWGKMHKPMEETAEEKTKIIELRILDVVALSFAGVTIIVLSDLIKEHLIADYMPAFPTILIVTTLALILAQFKFISRLQGAFDLGNISFYLFFCAVGAMINVKMAIVLSPVIFAYVLIMMVVHLVSIYGIGRLFRLDIGVLTIASAAAKSGPATIPALANIHGWKDLILPGMAMGLLGYAVGNYLGFAVAYFMKAILGG